MRDLRREEARFNLKATGTFYSKKTILVTGAAGSIGSALCTQLAELGCARLVMLDHFDHGLIDIVEQVRRANPRIDAVEALCDIRDRDRLTAWFMRVKPDVVIHAAALKHVHLGERHPAECLLTNLIGMSNTLIAASAAGSSHFMLVSSDKAASPVCVMGATKRLAELHMLGVEMERATRMRLKSVRFGNVLGSQGSVTPRFTSQIAAGGPLEVTHPEMQRFFMSADEAVGLILSVTAFEDRDAQRTAAYFMEMGDPVSILDLGHSMIERSGKKINVEFTGLRPGEKLKEELFDQYETVSPCGLPGVFRVAPTSAGAHISSADVANLETLARTMDGEILRQRVFARLDSRLGREDRVAG